MQRRKTLMSIAAVVSLFGMLMYAIVPVAAEDTSDWLIERTSADAGATGGRELPTMTPDGRYVAYVGRGEGAGVWISDRLMDKTTQLTTGMDFNPAISNDGEYVAFSRYGSTRQVLLVEVATKSVTNVSINSNGDLADGISDFPSLSADARYVAFHSTATNLDASVGDPGAGGGPTKVYRHDRVTGETFMVSVNNDGLAAKGNAVKPDISADGQLVAFASDADNLIDAVVATLLDERVAYHEDEDGEEEEGVQHVYVRDITAGATEVVSVDNAGVPGTAISSPLYGPTMSLDGRYVAFESLAPLVADDTNDDIDVFVRDRTAGTTVRASLDENGDQVDLENPVIEEPVIEEPVAFTTTEFIAPVIGAGPAISGDGTAVAFESGAELTADDENGVVDPYLHYLDDVTTIRLGLAVDGGAEASGTRTDGHTGEEVPQTNGYDVAINMDGRYVSFVGNGDLAADRPEAEDHEDEEVPHLTAALEEEEDSSTEPAVFTRTTGLPTVTAVSPATGENAATVTVTITGTNFSVDPVIDMGDGFTVDSMTYVSATSLEADLSIASNAPLGLHDLEVVNRGGDKATLAEAFTVTAATNPNLWYVMALYPDLLERPADEAGLDFWTKALDDGAPRSDLVDLLTTSEEFLTKLVNDTYDDVLHRSPDGAGLTYWKAELAAGMQWEELKIYLLSSEEYFLRNGGTNEAFVNALFDDMLERTPDAAGLAYFVDALDDGTPRDLVASAIVRSEEASSVLVVGLYDELLHRAPDAAGLAYWVAAIGSGESSVTIMKLLVASPEYYNLAQTGQHPANMAAVFGS